MQGLKDNEALINLKSRLLSQAATQNQTAGATPMMPRPQSEPTEEERQQKCTPEEIAMTITDKRIIFFVPAEFGLAMADSSHRPAFRIQGDRLFLVREEKCTKNFRRIGTKIEGGKGIQFQIDHKACDGLTEWLAGLECGKSWIAIKWIATDVWHIDIVRENLCDRRRYAYSPRSYRERKIVGAIPMGESIRGANKVEKTSQPSAAAASSVPAQPELPEQGDCDGGSPISIEEIRSAVKLINRAKDQMFEELWIEIDEDDHLHAILHLI